MAIPDISKVVGAAESNSAGSVGFPQGSIFKVTGVRLKNSPSRPDAAYQRCQRGIRTVGNISKVVAQALLLLRLAHTDQLHHAKLGSGRRI